MKLAEVFLWVCFVVSLEFCLFEFYYEVMVNCGLVLKWTCTQIRLF